MDKLGKSRAGRLHSKHPDDARWRAQQAQVDADIEGLARDLEADRMIAEMRKNGVALDEQLARLKAYFIACSSQESALS